MHLPFYSRNALEFTEREELGNISLSPPDVDVSNTIQDEHGSHGTKETTPC